MSVSNETWFSVFKRDKGQCRYCEMDLLAKFELYLISEVDHLLPVGEPNRDDEDNLVLSCRACNGRLSRAHGKGLTDFEERKSYLKKPSTSTDRRLRFKKYQDLKLSGWQES